MELVEEETLFDYRPSCFYPVRIGEVWKDRYQVKAKVGYGGSSTVWLCSDASDNDYKIIKVLATDLAGDHESEVVHHLNGRSTDQLGQHCIRKPCDEFTLEQHLPQRVSRHRSLVFPPLGITMLEHLSRREEVTLGIAQVKFVAIYFLHALQYLHECGVVHTDIKLNNIHYLLPECEEHNMLSALESAPKGPSKDVDTKRTIYTSTPMEYDNPFTYPILCDFGTSVFGQTDYIGTIQTLPYRAPEVLFRANWSSSVDVWNFGVLIWQLMFGRFIFGNHSEAECLRLMVKYLGCPPPEMLAASGVTAEYFYPDGKWKSSKVVQVHLKDLIQANDEKQGFSDFMLSILKWIPSQRKTASELLRHPWLQ